MTSVNYDETQHHAYHRARSLSGESVRLWGNWIRGYVENRDDLEVLDLGSGTGRFSTLLADSLRSRVIGVEPSYRMCSVAQREPSHPRVQYTRGVAEQIPCRGAIFNVAWLSMVLHHISDLDLCSKEMARVLLPGGMLFLRNAFRDRLQNFRMYEFFPEAFQVDQARMPEVPAIRELFERRGFSFVDFTTVNQRVDPGLREHANRLRLRAQSTFELIPDEAFRAGIRRMEETAAREEMSRPVVDRIDVLVLRNPVR